MTDAPSMRERMLAGELYIADDPELGQESARARKLIHQLNISDPTDATRHREILTELLAAFGDGSEIRPPFYCDYGYQTSIGARCFLNWGVVSLDVATVTIGDDVQIGPNVQLLTGHSPDQSRLAPGQVGGGRADRAHGQRLAGRRRDRRPGCHDRKEHRRRRRRGCGPRSARERGGCGKPGWGDPHLRRLIKTTRVQQVRTAVWPLRDE